MTESSTSFTRKQLRATFKLGEGDFGEKGYDTVAFSGMRMSADIHFTNNHQMTAMQLRIWGLTFEHMQKLLRKQRPPLKQRDNIVMLEAGDAETGLHTVYEGNINLAWGDLSNQPDAFFLVQSIGLMKAALKPLPPVSYRGAANVADVMQGIATSAGCKFENHNVDVKLSNPYFPGTAREQLRACADAAGIEWTYDKGTVAIWPAGKTRGNKTPILTPDTGLIGYPAFNEFGLIFRALYDPAVVINGPIEIKGSQIPTANGKWKVYELAYNLEAEMPGGNWEMTFQCHYPLGGVAA